MSIIDDLKLGSADSATIARFESMARAGRLSEAQIRYGKALIASDGDAQAKADVDARFAASRPGGALYEARVAKDAAKAAAAAARKAAGPSARQLKIQAEYEAWVAAGRPAK